jgi:hypothetical protein
MFYCRKEKKHIRGNLPFEIGGVTYPAKMLRNITEKELVKLGLERVEDINEPANREFYYVTEKLHGHQREWISEPMNLDFLKQKYITIANGMAAGRIAPTDWMVVKAMETGRPMPPAIVAFRQACRDRANEIVRKVTMAQNVDEIQKISMDMEFPKNPLDKD